MNILFIISVDDIFTPQKPLRTPEQMQFGISYISSLLKQKGHSTRLAVLSRLLGPRNKRVIDGMLSGYKPDLVCFTSVSTEYPFIVRIARYVRERFPGTYLIIGGPHVSLNPESAMREAFDAVCIGEGEYPALELAAQLERGVEPSGIKNLWFKKGARVEKNPVRPFLQDLDALPMPDREMWREWTSDKPDVRHPVLLGRGCPFECTYCCNHALKALAQGPYVRFRLTEKILGEIKEIISLAPGVKSIYLEVETIGADKAWALDLCDKLAELNAALDIPVSYGTNLRIAPNVDLETLFSAFEKSNFTTVNIGVESGSERVRREILNRHYSNKDIVRAAGLAREHKLKVNFYNLIGVPGETAEDFKETIKINRECLPDKAYAHIFYPYPGTKLYDVCIKKALLPEPVSTKLERCMAVLDLPGFSRKQIQKSFVRFGYDIYKGKRPMHKILAGVLVAKCRSNPLVHSLYRRFTYSALYKILRNGSSII
ncbi:MAG: radical SAM protein [Candidatus Omnitrophota bacterium]